MPRAVASVLDVKESLGRTLTESIVAALQSRRALLVLDNCEHVIDGAADLAHAVAEGCPNVRILATSREGLGLRDEQLVVVAPLEPAGPGVELFNERAIGGLADVRSVGQPGRRRGDLPPPRRCPARHRAGRRAHREPLAGRPGGAARRSSAAPDRRSAGQCRATSDAAGDHPVVVRPADATATSDVPVSVDLRRYVRSRRRRSDRRRRDLDLASLDRVDVDDLLGDLVDRSMLIVESGPFGRRFRLLETMRQFGAEHLSETGTTDVIAARHAQWCLDEVTHIRELLAGPAEIEGVARLDELWPNLRAAVDWACATDDRRLARRTRRSGRGRGLLRSRSEIGDWAERILAITPPDDEELIVFGLTWAARRYMRNLDIEGYERLVGRYGEPDHPMIRYARGFLDDDYAVMAESAAQATGRAAPARRALRRGPQRARRDGADAADVAGSWRNTTPSSPRSPSGIARTARRPACNGH